MAARQVEAVDIRAVAKRAGVSIATVSRVMNGVASVDGKLASRVLKAAADLNYTPNTQARALVSGRSGMLGLIVSEITNPFFPELIQNFEDSAVARGYEILIGSTNYSAQRMAQCVRRMVERKVEGVAVMTFGMDEELLEQLAGRNIPVASVGPARSVPGVYVLRVNYRLGIHEAVQHLAVMGHRRIAFLSGPLRMDTAQQRQEAFCDAMRTIGAPILPGFTVEGDHTMEGGYAGAERLLRMATRPSAIVCSNDMTAIGVLHAVSKRGLRVPDDISVIGFDDIHMAQFTIPPLTTIRMSCADLANAALDALQRGNVEVAEDDAATAPTVLTHLIVRQTTGYPAQPQRRRAIASKAKKRIAPREA